MKSLVIAAVSSLAFAACASAALAEDRGASGGYLGEGREAGERLLVSETADNDATDDIRTARADAVSGSCGRALPTSSGSRGCGDDKSRPRNLTRRIDWSSVGPSTEDFASSDEGLRLQGARLIGKYRF